MKGGTAPTRVAAAAGILVIVAVAGWGSLQNRRERAAVAPPSASTPPTAPVTLASLDGCWSQGGMSTEGDAASGIGARIDLRYCLAPPKGSTMTLEQEGDVRCRAPVLARRLGERVRLAMADPPACAFGEPLPSFDAVCDAPALDEMACDIDWGGGLVETFRLRRS